MIILQSDFMYHLLEIIWYSQLHNWICFRVKYYNFLKYLNFRFLNLIFFPNHWSMGTHIKTFQMKNYNHSQHWLDSSSIFFIGEWVHHPSDRLNTYTKYCLNYSTLLILPSVIKTKCVFTVYLYYFICILLVSHHSLFLLIAFYKLFFFSLLECEILMVL